MTTCKSCELVIGHYRLTREQIWEYGRYCGFMDEHM